MPGLAAQPLYVILALRQKWAMADDAKKLDELTKVITDTYPYSYAYSYSYLYSYSYPYTYHPTPTPNP